MIDLSPIKAYIDEPDSFMLDFVPHEIESVGLEKFLEYNFNILDCTRVTKNGLRPMQTIGCPYRRTITETILIIKNYIEEDKQDVYYERLLKRHNDNIEYEKINPPIWYSKDKDKPKNEKQTKTKDKKQKDNNNKDKPKKQTVAEQKLINKLNKINVLSFKIKPQN